LLHVPPKTNAVILAPRNCLVVNFQKEQKKKKHFGNFGVFTFGKIMNLETMFVFC